MLFFNNLEIVWINDACDNLWLLLKLSLWPLLWSTVNTFLGVVPKPHQAQISIIGYLVAFFIFTVCSGVLLTLWYPSAELLVGLWPYFSHFLTMLEFYATKDGITYLSRYRQNIVTPKQTLISIYVKIFLFKINHSSLHPKLY